MQAVPIELGPYTGGINLADPETKLQPNEVRNSKNTRIGTRGELTKRPGHRYYANNSATGKMNGDALVNLLVRFYRADGTRKLIGAAGGFLYEGNDGTGVWSQININGSPATTMEASDLCDWMIYKDRLYITDGTRVQRYNGTNNLFAGHYSHAAPTLVSSNGAGSLTPSSTYKYRVASVAGNMGEGPYGAEGSVALGGTHDTVDLSAMAAATAEYEETAKRIYRTKANGTDYFFLAEIPTGTAVYTDLTADTNLGEPYIPVIAPPSTARYCIMGNDERAYWFGMSATGEQSLVYVSDIGFPDRIPSTSFFTVRNNDGDILTGAGLVPGGIAFAKRNSFWLSAGYGTGLINIAPKDKRGSGTGTISPFSIVWTPTGLIFLSQNKEIYRFDGTNLYEIGRNVGTEFQGMSAVSLEKVVAAYHDYKYIISYDYRNQKGYNWKTLEYDTITQKWHGPHENGDFYNPSYYSVFDSQLDKGELYWGEAKAGNGSYAYVRTETDIYDRGNRFLSQIETGRIPLAKLAETTSIKAFIEGTFAADTRITITHIDETNVEDEVEVSTPIDTDAGRFNDGITAFYLAVTVGRVSAKFGQFKLIQIYEAPFGAAARSRIPKFKIDDGGLASSFSINNISVLVEGEPLV